MHFSCPSRSEDIDMTTSHCRLS